MAQQQATEELTAPPLVDATSSYPNTPLSRSHTEQRGRRYCPAASGKLLFSLTSTPCLPSAKGVQQSHVLNASCSAGTFQLQEASAHLSVLSPLEGYDSSSATQPPPCSSAIYLFDQRCRSFTEGQRCILSNEGQRCRSFIEVLVATACFSCQVVSRQALEQHVRKRKFKRSCEALLKLVRLSAGENVAPAFPGKALLPVLVAAASLCTRKQQCRLLRSGHEESTSGSSYISSGNYNASFISLPYFGASAYSAQAQCAPSGPASNVPCAHAAGSLAPAYAQRTIAGGTLSDDNAFTVVDLSFSLAADRSPGGSHPHLLHRVLLSSAGSDETASSQQLASTAAKKQRTFPVQHICLCCNEDGIPGVALQIDSPAQQGKEGDGEVIIPLDGVASAADKGHALVDAAGGKNGSEAAVFAERMTRIHEEEGGAQPGEAFVTAQKVDVAIACDGEERQRASSASRLTKRFPARSAPACGSATVESLTSPAAPMTAVARAGGEIAVPADAPPAATVEAHTVEKEQEFVGGRGDGKGRVSIEDERNGASAAAAALVVARLTRQQLTGVVGTAKLYCEKLEGHVQCVAENMLQLQRLSQLEAVRHMHETWQKNDTCTPGEERHVDRGADKDSGDSGANGRHTGRAYADAGERNSSNGKHDNFQREVPGTERPQSVATSRIIEDREAFSAGDRTGAITASPSPLQQQQLAFMSALQQLRLPRDKDLTAAEVLGLSASLDTTATTAESASESGDQLQDAAAGSDAPAAVPEEAPAAAATTTLKQREAGEPSDSEGGERLQRSPRGVRGEHSEDARHGLALAADGISTAVAAAVETEGDVRHTGRCRKGSKQQKRRIVSLADVLDLSVLERGRESAVALKGWQQEALTAGQLRKIKEAALRRRVAEAMDPVVDVADVDGRERKAKQVRRHSRKSSVILLEPSEGSGDGDAQIGDIAEAEHDMSPSKRKRNGETRRDADDTSPGAGNSSHDEEDLLANLREVERLYEVVGQEVLQLLKLVTFYENFSAEYLRHAMQGRDFSDGECSRNGECM